MAKLRALGAVGVVFMLTVACAPSGTIGGGGDDDDSPDATSPRIDADPNAPDADPSASDAGPTGRVLRFVALGDTGEGNPEQRQVAIAMRDLCAERGCDFAVLLGDNIYDSGVESVVDSQWQSDFEVPYADVDLPFYAVLGNHDYGGHLSILSLPGVGNEWEKGPIQVAYSDVSTKWRMPATHYTLRRAHVGFIVLDTNSILWDNTDHGDQRAWWPQALAEIAGSEWTIVLGHHPYRSNGNHGNAGSYEAPELGGFNPPNPIPIVGGADMKNFFDDVVCGTGALYISGHDHSRQWLNEPDALCGTELIVSGAGAKVTSLEDHGNAAFYQDASKPGFLYVVIDGNTLTAGFYDLNGNLDFERTITQ